MILFFLILAVAYNVISIRSARRNIKRLKVGKSKTDIIEEQKAFQFAIAKQTFYLIMYISFFVIVGILMMSAIAD